MVNSPALHMVVLCILKIIKLLTMLIKVLLLHFSMIGWVHLVWEFPANLSLYGIITANEVHF